MEASVTSLPYLCLQKACAALLCRNCFFLSMNNLGHAEHT